MKSYIRSQSTLTQKIDEDLVLLNLKDGCYYCLQGTGTQLWAWLEQPRTDADLLQLCLDQFDESKEILQNDIREFLSSLLKPGLVEISAE